MDSMLFYIQRRQSMASAISIGLRSAILAYYENYTDAEELEAEFITALEVILEETSLGIDLYELIRDAESDINETGGIQSDTDGTRHQVKTNHVWAYLEEEENDS